MQFKMFAKWRLFYLSLNWLNMSLDQSMASCLFGPSHHLHPDCCIVNSEQTSMNIQTKKVIIKVYLKMSFCPVLHNMSIRFLVKTYIPDFGQHWFRQHQTITGTNVDSLSSVGFLIYTRRQFHQNMSWKTIVTIYYESYILKIQPQLPGGNGLTHFGLVTPYGDRDLGQHWLR